MFEQDEVEDLLRLNSKSPKVIGGAIISLVGAFSVFTTAFATGTISDGRYNANNPNTVSILTVSPKYYATADYQSGPYCVGATIIGTTTLITTATQKAVDCVAPGTNTAGPQSYCGSLTYGTYWAGAWSPIPGLGPIGGMC
jgi:hypothetical protein